MDFESLRKDIIDYYGAAMFSGFPMAMMDVSDVEKMTNEELIRECKRIGFKLNKYERNKEDML